VIIRTETWSDRASTKYSLPNNVDKCEGVVQRCQCVAEYDISSNSYLVVYLFIDSSSIHFTEDENLLDSQLFASIEYFWFIILIIPFQDCTTIFHV
jgi:hypothetical protein